MRKNSLASSLILQLWGLSTILSTSLPTLSSNRGIISRVFKELSSPEHDLSSEKGRGQVLILVVEETTNLNDSYFTLPD